MENKMLRSQFNSLPAAGLLMVALFLTGVASAQQLAPNQTNGFGNNRLVTFTYLQSFDCVDQPLLDLDFNGIKAQSDPNEMQTPICQAITEPTADPTGGNIKHTAHLYVFLPMFSVDNDQNLTTQCRARAEGDRGNSAAPHWARH
jgi:hypothetical protein